REEGHGMPLGRQAPNNASRAKGAHPKQKAAPWAAFPIPQGPLPKAKASATSLQQGSGATRKMYPPFSKPLPT
ncbi:hypothetical protein MRX56_16055, partial [Pseudodesulfovibrio sp. S3-i]